MITLFSGSLRALMFSFRFSHYAEAGDRGSVLPTGFPNITFSSVE
jgi:hypothetical protein